MAVSTPVNAWVSASSCASLVARVTAIALDPPRGLVLHGLDTGRVDADPGAHGGRHGDALQIASLGGRRLGLDDAVDERLRVGDERVLGKRRLAHGRMDDAG